VEWCGVVWGQLGPNKAKRIGGNFAHTPASPARRPALSLQLSMPACHNKKIKDFILFEM